MKIEIFQLEEINCNLNMIGFNNYWHVNQLSYNKTSKLESRKGGER